MTAGGAFERDVVVGVRALGFARLGLIGENFMGFKYAIFDMDGLMFDTEALFIEGYRQCVCPKTGIEYSPEKLKSLIGLNSKDAGSLFPKLFGDNFSHRECMDICREWMSDHIKTKGIPVKPGLLELLCYLKDNGVKLAVASSSNIETVKSYVEIAGVMHFFDTILGGDKVTKGKPDPQIFLMAAELLGCQDVSQCLVFEDSRNGLLAGCNAGMKVIIVPDMMDPTIEYPGMAYAKVSTLKDAVGVLESGRRSGI